MSKIKHLGKFTDEGEFIELPFTFDAGKYRVEIKPTGENKREKTVYVDESGKMLLPNFNGKKAFVLGSNIFHIYKVVNSKRERFENGGFNRFSLFLKAKDVIGSEELLQQFEDLKRQFYLLKSQTVQKENTVADGDDDFLFDGLDEVVTDSKENTGSRIEVETIESESKVWTITHTYGMNATIDKLLCNTYDLKREGFLKSIQYEPNLIIIKFSLARKGDVYIKYN